jgi:hypothetical protein
MRPDDIERVRHSAAGITLVLVGVLGAGKSALGNALLKEFRWCVVRALVRALRVALSRSHPLMFIARSSAAPVTAFPEFCGGRMDGTMAPRLVSLSSPPAPAGGWVLDTPGTIVPDIFVSPDIIIDFGRQLLSRVREAAAFCRGRCVVLCVWNGEHLADALVDGDLPLPWLAALRAARAQVASPYGRGGALCAAPRCHRDDSWICCGCRCECAAALLHVITRADMVPRFSRDVVSRIFVRETKVTGDQPFWIVCNGAGRGPHAAYRDDSARVWLLLRAAFDVAPEAMASSSAPLGRPLPAPTPTSAAASMTVMLYNETGYALVCRHMGLSPPRYDERRRWLQLPQTIGARSSAAIQLRSVAEDSSLGWWSALTPGLGLSADGTVDYLVTFPQTPMVAGAVLNDPTVTVTLAWTGSRTRSWTLTWTLTPGEISDSLTARILTVRPARCNGGSVVLWQ